MISDLASVMGLPRGVRLALPEEAEEMAIKGRRFFDHTILPGYFPYDEASLEQTILELIERHDGVVMVLEHEGEIVGGIAGFLLPMYMNRGVRAAQQVFWFVLPEHRGRRSLNLLTAWEQWAKRNRAGVIYSGAKMDDNYESMSVVMRRRGYKPLETVFIREV